MSFTVPAPHPGVGRPDTERRRPGQPDPTGQGAVPHPRGDAAARPEPQRHLQADPLRPPAQRQGRHHPAHPGRGHRRVRRAARSGSRGRPMTRRQAQAQAEEHRPPPRPRQRRGLDLPLPQRLRRLRLGHHADLASGPGSTSTARPARSCTTSGSSSRPRPTAAPVPTSTPTLAQYIARWLADVVEPNLEPATYAYYEAIARLYISPALGRKRIDRLQTREVQTWLNKLARTCQCCVQGKDAARPEDRRRCCADRRLLPGLPRPPHGAGSPQHPPDGPQPRQGLRRTGLPERRGHGQGAQPAAAPPQRLGHGASRRPAGSSPRPGSDGDPLYAAYVLILVNGLRKGEVLGLVWSSIDEDEARTRHQLAAPAHRQAADPQEARQDRGLRRRRHGAAAGHLLGRAEAAPRRAGSRPQAGG